MLLKSLAPAAKNAEPGITMLISAFTGVAVGVLEPIQMVFKHLIVLGDQSWSIIPEEQPAGIGLGQGPAHHRFAFVDHRAIGQHHDRHRSLGRALQHLHWFSLQFDFSPMHHQACFEHGPAGPHRKRATAEAVKDWQHELLLMEVSVGDRLSRRLIELLLPHQEAGPV